MDIVAHVVKYNSQTNGRDKLCRLFQYASKYAWWHCEKHGLSTEFIKKFKNLETALSSTRKVMRFGKSLDMIMGAWKSQNVPDILIRLTLTIAKLNQAMYLLLDHYVWLVKVGLLQGDSKKLAKTAAKFWLVTIAANLIRNLYDILTIYSNEKIKAKRRVSGQQAVTKCIMQNKPVAVDTLKNICDLWLPMSSLGFVNAPAGFVGLCGVCSSYMGIMCAWNPVLKLSPS